MKSVKVSFGGETRRVKCDALKLSELVYSLASLFPTAAHIDRCDLELHHNNTLLTEEMLQKVHASQSPCSFQLVNVSSTFQSQRNQMQPMRIRNRFKTVYERLLTQKLEVPFPPVFVERKAEEIHEKITLNSSHDLPDWEIISTHGDDVLEEEICLPARISGDFYVNHKLCTPSTDVPRCPPTRSLALYLRGMGLTGTKIGCGEGGCGACTVLLSWTDPVTGLLRSEPINSCLRPVAAVAGMVVTTIEGVGSNAAGYHPVQQRLADNAGSQCGYCSPGFCMTAVALLESSHTKGSRVSPNDLETALAGHICRCTGYRPIVQAFRSLCCDSSQASSTGSAKPAVIGCLGACATCPHHDSCCGDVEEVPYALRRAGQKGWSDELDKRSVSRVSIKWDTVWRDRVCADLASLSTPSAAVSLDLSVSVLPSNSPAWYSASSLADIFAVQKVFFGRRVQLAVGYTASAVAKYYALSPADSPAALVDIRNVAELGGLELTDAGLTIGATVTLGVILEALRRSLPSLPTAARAAVEAVARHLHVVANRQVRAMGSWAGNIVLAVTHNAFASDVLILWLALRASLTWATCLNKGVIARRIESTSEFLERMSASGLCSLDTDVLSEAHLPWTQPGQYFDSYKIAARHLNSHAIVNAAFHIWTDLQGVVTDSTLVVGGVRPGPTICSHASRVLQARFFLKADTLTVALAAMATDCSTNTPSNQYLSSLACALFYKFFLTQWSRGFSLSPRFQSAVDRYQRPPSSGLQVFEPDSSEAPVSEAVPKLSGVRQAAGEALYACDFTRESGLSTTILHAAFVLSSHANGSIISFDASVALAIPGVVRFFTAHDLTLLGASASNNIGMFPGDEELWASTHVGYVGQPIGLLVAESPDTAELAASLVVVQYGAHPSAPIFTIPEAIAAKSFLLDNKFQTHIPSIVSGDVDEALAAAPHRLDGILETGAQAHFYMETQAAFATLEENGVLRLRTSTQSPTDYRSSVAAVLGCPSNKVLVEAGTHVGGGFGGKLTRGRPVAASVAVAASLLRLPVSMQLSRHDDLASVGKRHPFLMQYSVGFNEFGVLQALHVQLYCNAGYSYDTTFGTSDMAQLWLDNCYHVPNFKSEGFCCKTNLPPFTTMRTPGVLQSVFMFEQIIERVAATLGCSARTIRERNFYSEGCQTPYGQILKDVTLKDVWSQCLESSCFEARLKGVNEYNSNNRWVKRGISIVPVKYGFELASAQAAVLISIVHDDGSIILSHSGCEIGQGLTTKVVQTIAFALKVPVALIMATSTSTEKIPNFNATGGSSTSEAVCAAALNACSELNARLNPFRTEANGSWAELVSAANAAGENLSASGWFSPPALVTPNVFDYFVWAAACVEVRVDVLTGETHVLRVDIVYDAGQSLNPIVDIGQIEGAFVQGLGFFMLEACEYDKTGRMLNNGTWDYKVPGATDIPIDMRVTLLPNAGNSRGVLRSKGSGEPPYVLAGAAHFAISEAVTAALAELPDCKTRPGDGPLLPIPATVEAVQRACQVDILQMLVE